MAAALASLGIVYAVGPFLASQRYPNDVLSMKDDDLDIIFDQLLQEYGAITFEAFINLLVMLFSSSCISGLV